MIWNTIPNEERLRLWKNLRDGLIGQSVEDQLANVAKFCSTIPFGTRTLDYYNPMTWPTPWEILFYGSFCTSSISLLMFYTLILIPTLSEVELVLVDDAGDIFLLPFIDNQFVLNYELGKVNRCSEIQDSFRIISRYPKEKIKNIT